MNINLQHYQEQYIQYVKKQEIDEELKKQFIEILIEKKTAKRAEMWNSMRIPLNLIKYLHNLANPFYIGFGNPESDILFIGKEKAFNIINNPESFLNESINNLLHWEKSNEKDEFSFNPKNPYMFYKTKYKHKIKGGETWGFYKNMTQKIVSKNENNIELKDDTFFNYCFTTEINHIPSKKTSNEKLINQRLDFLQKEDFFKSFKHVIIGAKGSVSKEEIKHIFGKSPIEISIILGNNKRTTFSIDVFEYENQKIILCNQLSGATGWTNEVLEKLIETIN
ncbi:hypothetical protein [Flavobacterium sasangense]|uniref:hypothetical protein n=1 Tax=Flavobacterium sasangense TaxID=503361 RepID=UPI00047D9B59|nr:hypothetical protein [Flavobacterium sasangense]